MKKNPVPLNKADELREVIRELREVTRAAREVLGDLRREKRDIEKIIDDGFETRVTTCIKQVEGDLIHWSDKLTKAMISHADECKEALLRRWQYIAATCAADPHIAQMIALHVLQDAGGSVRTDSAQWWLVREKKDDDGTSTFAFPGKLSRRADGDPKTQEAIMDAVREQNPEFHPFPWPPKESTEGINVK